MSSVRGMDAKDNVKSLRERAQYDIAYAKDSTHNRLRPDITKVNPLDTKKVVVENTIGKVKRGGNEADLVKNTRDIARQARAYNPFTIYSTPQENKVKSVVGGAF
mgnify:CR=1 FL=1